MKKQEKERLEALMNNSERVRSERAKKAWITRKKKMINKHEEERLEALRILEEMIKRTKNGRE